MNIDNIILLLESGDEHNTQLANSIIESHILNTTYEIELQRKLIDLGYFKSNYFQDKLLKTNGNHYITLTFECVCKMKLLWYGEIHTSKGILPEVCNKAWLTKDNI